MRLTPATTRDSKTNQILRFNYWNQNRISINSTRQTTRFMAKSFTAQSTTSSRL